MANFRHAAVDWAGPIEFRVHEPIRYPDSYVP